MRSGMTLVGLAVAAALASGCDIEAQSRSAEGSFDRTVKVTGPVDLDIVSRSGRIDVRVGDGDAVRIVGRIHAYGSFFGLVGYTPEEQAKSLASSPPIEQSGSAISVGDIRDPVLGSNVSISYEVTVPPDTRLRTSSRSGDQTIELVRGPVVASSRSGSIEVGRVAGDVEIETRSGRRRRAAPAGRWRQSRHRDALGRHRQRRADPGGPRPRPQARQRDHRTRRPSRRGSHQIGIRPGSIAAAAGDSLKTTERSCETHAGTHHECRTLTVAAEQPAAENRGRFATRASAGRRQNERTSSHLNHCRAKPPGRRRRSRGRSFRESPRRNGSAKGPQRRFPAREESRQARPIPS